MKVTKWDIKNCDSLKALVPYIEYLEMRSESLPNHLLLSFSRAIAERADELKIPRDKLDEVVISYWAEIEDLKELCGEDPSHPDLETLERMDAAMLGGDFIYTHRATVKDYLNRWIRVFKESDNGN